MNGANISAKQYWQLHVGSLLGQVFSTIHGHREFSKYLRQLYCPATLTLRQSGHGYLHR